MNYMFQNQLQYVDKMENVWRLNVPSSNALVYLFSDFLRIQVVWKSVNTKVGEFISFCMQLWKSLSRNCIVVPEKSDIFLKMNTVVLYPKTETYE